VEECVHVWLLYAHCLPPGPFTATVWSPHPYCCPVTACLNPGRPSAAVEGPPLQEWVTSPRATWLISVGWDLEPDPWPLPPQDKTIFTQGWPAERIRWRGRSRGNGWWECILVLAHTASGCGHPLQKIWIWCARISLQI
jgi:hypothetical protein